MKKCGSAEGRLFLSLLNSEHHYECSLSLSSFIVRRYQVEEDGGSLQIWSIWQQVQVNRKANMVLLSRMFQ